MGDSLFEILEGVTAERAAARPVANAHSIWELVLHIAAWDGVVRRRMTGVAVAELPDKKNFLRCSMLARRLGLRRWRRFGECMRN